MHESLGTDWAQQVLGASDRLCQKQEALFLSLVDAAEGNVTPFVAETLMKTFNAKPDFGTQERVCSVLSGGDHAVTANALLLEMPRLLDEAPEWAEALLCNELEFRADHFFRLLAGAPGASKVAVAAVAARPDFAEFQPVASRLLDTGA